MSQPLTQQAPASQPLIHGVRQVERVIARIERVVISIALGIMLLAVTLDVLDRTFALPWPNLSEVALMAMAVLAFIGSAYCVYSGGHITVDVAEAISSPRVKRALAIAAQVSIVVFSAAILYFGTPFLLYILQLKERTPELELPLAFPVGSLLVGSTLSIFHVICRSLPSDER
jgi:TRAP-type C4-dicarboxylate transport system permease small subunit